MAFIMLFAVSIPVDATEYDYTDNSVTFEFSPSLYISEDILQMMEVAQKRFTEDLRQMTFDSIEDEIAALHELTAKHFGAIDEMLENALKNNLASVDARWTNSFWVKDHEREWYNSNREWPMPVRVFHGQMVGGVYMEGNLDLFRRTVVRSSVTSEMYLHIGQYIGYIYSSGFSR